MVRFEGILSDKCVVYRIKASLLIVIIGVALFLIVGAPLLIVLSVLYDYNVIGSIILTALLALLLLMFIGKYCKVKKPRVNVQIELLANTEFIEYTVSIEKTEKIPTNNIKKVIKKGQCYYLIRKHGNLSSSLMVEESLLKEGKIEEFESLFNGKIEVRT